MTKDISVIGAGGRMGFWFLKYLSRKRGITLRVYDKNINSISKKYNVIIESNLNECISKSDIVILCVPIHVLPKMINHCSRYMKTNSFLVEISSIKHKSFKSLSKISDYITPICIHPMFGPGASQIANLKILFIPVRNYKKEFAFVKRLFAKSNILPIKNDTLHDKLMGTILGLTHYLNIIFVDILSSKPYADLRLYGGTTFKIQCMISEGILNDDLDLINSLLMDNPFFVREMKKVQKTLLKYNQFILTKDEQKLSTNLRNIRSTIQRYSDISTSYNIMYKFIELLNSRNY